MIVKLLTEHHLEFLSLKGGCRGSYESTLVKMSNCWKYHVSAQLLFVYSAGHWLSLPFADLLAYKSQFNSPFVK